MKYYRVILVFLLIALSFIILVQRILLPVAQKKAENIFHTKYHYSLKTEELELKFPLKLVVSKIRLCDSLNNTLFYSDSLSCSLRIFPLLTGKIRVGCIKADSIVFATDLIDHYLKYRNINHEYRDRDQPAKSLLSKIYNAIPVLFEFFPRHLIIREIKLVSLISRSENVNIQQLTYLRKKLYATGYIVNKADSSTFSLSGEILPSKKICWFNVSKTSDSHLSVPFLKQFTNATIQFDTASFSFQYIITRKGLMALSCKSKVVFGLLQHYKVAQQPVSVDSFFVDLSMQLERNRFIIDSSSKVILNDMPFKFGFYIIPDSLLQFTVPSVKWPASVFFNSLPDGVFQNVRGIKASGSLSFSLFFELPLKRPDSLLFSINLKPEKFSVLQWGQQPLDFFKDTFTYEVYDEERRITRFFVGPANQYYTPLEHISPYLRYSVLTSEDGGFYHHAGFHPEAFRRSIATNIKERRFVRGGSTISMQLVKNLFLSRNKNIARKIEEALIVWIIETNHLVSKDRMFETYLNIIEWGPGIYGVGQASEFYFNKKPSNLNLNESIFLASVIPNPRRFRYTFDEYGQTRPFYKAYQQLILHHLFLRGCIVPEDTLRLIPQISLPGRAKDYIQCSGFSPCDTVLSDSSIIIRQLFENVVKE